MHGHDMYIPMITYVNTNMPTRTQIIHINLMAIHSTITYGKILKNIMTHELVELCQILQKIIS